MSIRNDLLEQILTAINSGGGTIPSDNFTGGFFDYNDAATQSAPISVIGNDPAVQLTNDTLGPQTIKTYAPTGVTDIWNPTTNQFDFSQLANGDMIDIRLALDVTTTAPNQSFDVDLVLGIGGSEYNIPFSRGSVKNAGTVQANRFNGIYIGDDNTRLNPAEFRISSDANASVVVSGWYCKIVRRGV